MTAFAITFVCSGNRFRSPLAEHRLRRALGDAPVEIQSLGTLELGALPPLPEAVTAGHSLGLDLSAHRARSLGGANLAEADLVIGFERAHVVTAVVDGKARRECTFTLPELVDLLEPGDGGRDGDQVERARTRVRRAAARRPEDRQLRAIPEIPDPLRRSHAQQAEIAAEIDRLTERLAALLFGAPA